MSSTRFNSRQSLHRSTRLRGPVVRSAAARDESAAEGAASTSLTVRRVLLALAAVSLLLPMNQAWTQIVAFPQAGLSSVALVAADLALLVACFRASSAAQLGKLERLLLLLALLTLVVDGALQMWLASGYGTDEGALQQGAAQALLAGQDPYGANLSSALFGWTQSSQWYTYQLGGGLVTSYGYPALPILLVTPFVWLTHGGQGVSIAYLLVLCLTLAMMFRRLPAGFKSLSVVVCVGFSPWLAGSIAGETQILAMAPLLIVAAGWSRIASNGRLVRGDVVNAIALGLAVSANQVTWFVAPFVVAGLTLVLAGRFGWEAGLRLAARYCLIAAAAFAAVNAPFFLWSPGAWVRGVAAPLTQHALPLGQGLISLSMFAHLGGGNLALFNYAGMAAFAAALGLYLLLFRQLGSAGFVLALIGLFLSARSLAGYWLFSGAVIVVAAACADRDAIRKAPDLAGRWLGRARRDLVVLGATVPALLLIGLALTSASPLTVRVMRLVKHGEQGAVSAITLSVTNRTGEPVSPHFTTLIGDRAMPPWRIDSGPATLAAHATARYRISALEQVSEPQSGIPFSVMASAPRPASISTSAVVGLSSSGAPPITGLN